MCITFHLLPSIVRYRCYNIRSVEVTGTATIVSSDQWQCNSEKQRKVQGSMRTSGENKPRLSQKSISFLEK